jgi:hypothetical protein
MENFEENNYSSFYKIILNYILSFLNTSKIWVIIYLMISLKIILLSIWFFVKYGTYAGSLCFLCNINVIFYFLTCIKTQILQKKYYQGLKQRYHAEKKCAESLKNDFECNLKLIEKNLHLFITRFQNENFQFQ